MLSPELARLYELNEEDRAIYRRFLPAEHKLLDALRLIPWQSFTPELEAFYCPGQGQPALPPLLVFKLEFLRYYCRLSDRETLARAQTDVLFRWFLQVPIQVKLPDASLLTRFRGRLGAAGFKRLFDRRVGLAREAGLVRDQLRLKDASHVLAKIAVPTTLGLLAQLRQRMLKAVEAVDAEAAAGFEIAAAQMRKETEQAGDEVRLAARLELVQDILHWIGEQKPPQEKDNPAWAKLQAVRQLAEKICGDLAHPEHGHRTLSVVDPDARRGKHGGFYDGYLVDLLVDADSELITAVDVLPADADEALSAVQLVQAEQAAHGNQIQQISLDGSGFHGEMLAALEGAQGLGVEVFTPPREFARTGAGFPASEFPLSADRTHVTCPAGQSSGAGRPHKNSLVFHYKRSQCAACPLVAACLPEMTPTRQVGRLVTKNQYEAQYARARAKAQTAAYAVVRRRHAAIERKLCELVRHHRGRFALLGPGPGEAATDHDQLCGERQAAAAAVAREALRAAGLRRPRFGFSPAIFYGERCRVAADPRFFTVPTAGLTPQTAAAA